MQFFKTKQMHEGPCLQICLLLWFSIKLSFFSRSAVDQISVKQKAAVTTTTAAAVTTAASTESSNSAKPFRPAQCLHKAFETEAERSVSPRRWPSGSVFP